jgi:Ala-tRNA(Pro) deacylase
MSDITEKIKDFLCKMFVPYELIQHGPTHTSEDSARERGDDLSIGAKALLMKVDDDFVMFVLSASLQVDSKRIREITGAKKIRFANSGELFTFTGLKPGAVPPFGRPIFPVDLYVDESVAQKTVIAFNAGSQTTSMKLQTSHYMRLVDAAVVKFSRPKMVPLD